MKSPAPTLLLPEIPSEAAVTPESEPAATTAAPPVEIEPAQTWQLVQHEQITELPEQDFRMTVQYPLIEGSDHDYVAWFNALIENFVQTELDENLTWVGEIEYLDGVGMFSDVRYSVTTSQGWQLADYPIQVMGEMSSLDSEQVLFHAGHEVLSILFANFFYYGGAHPGSYYWPLNYDFTIGRELALSDLFIPGAAFLERIADYCSRQLRENLEFDLWEEGVAPLAENYQDWVVTPAGLLILFEEYQVAPYAAGPQQVVIPYDVLADILHPQGPLGRFAVEQ